MNNVGGGRDGLRDIDGAAVGPRQAAAAVLPVNNVGGGRDGLIGIGGATAGQRRAPAAAVLPVNNHGGSCDGGSAAGSSGDVGERPRRGRDDLGDIGVRGGHQQRCCR